MMTATVTLSHNSSQSCRNRNVKQEHCKHSDSKLWVASQLLDYGMCLILCFSQMVWGVPLVLRVWYTPGLPLVVNLLKVLVLQGLLGVFLLHSREQLHFWLLGARVASSKTGPLTWKNWALVLRTIACVQGWMALMETQQWIDRPKGFGSLEFWTSAYSQFYAMLILRDLFLMWPLHRLFHNSRALYQHMHKTHHQVQKDAQGLHAFHIDVLDLLVENIGAYALLLLAQYLSGSGKLGIHWFSISAIMAHDGALHSINPHSSLYFNPLLDHLLKPNICHQLHHAVNDEYFRFIPIHHLLDPSRREADALRYNQVFKTKFRLA